MAGKGGGAWKVAYADFVTAMMAFFLVMWITSQGKDIKEAVAHHFREPIEPLIPGEGFPAGGKGVSHAHGERGAAFTPNDHRDGPDARRPRVLVMRRGEHFGTGTVIYFADESVALDNSAMDRLDQLVPQLIGKPHLVEIRGHASRRPLPPDSPFPNTWDVSYARCMATMKYLEEQGIAAERLRLSQAAGHEPYSDGTDVASVARNPRVEVFVLGETVEE